MKTTAFAILSVVLVCCNAAYADMFGSGENLFEIEFVTIGNPGNAADTTGTPNPAGKVDNTFRIGKFEISEDMINKANALGGLGLTHDNRGANKPATSVSWFGAAKFVNLLNTSSGSTEAYKFDGDGNFRLWRSEDAGYNPANLYRNSLATYFLPSVDEWYKAAYYNGVTGSYGDYPTAGRPTAVATGTAPDTAVYATATGSVPADITLAGGLSPYGTMGQGGNVWEWEETDTDLVNDSVTDLESDGGLISSRIFRGGGRHSFTALLSSLSVLGSQDPINESNNVGFRVASIPEPTTCGLALAALCLAMSRRRTC